MTKEIAPRDWADDRAEEIIELAFKCSAKAALGLVASMLRLTREEGIGEGLRRVDERMKEIFKPKVEQG